jgi:osmoprotectant transport system substrate-binding protein
VVREAVLKAYPQIADWLQPVFASLDEKTLQQLNASIAGRAGCEESGRRLSATKGLLK